MLVIKSRSELGEAEVEEDAEEGEDVVVEDEAEAAVFVDETLVDRVVVAFVPLLLLERSILCGYRLAYSWLWNCETFSNWWQWTRVLLLLFLC